MGLDNSRCKINDRISQQTVLAMLQSPQVVEPQKGERVQWTDENGITKTYRVYSVGRDEVGLEGETEVFYVPKSSIISSAAKPTFLDKLSRDEWSIDSFDAKNRTVCISIHTDVGSHHMTLTLPVLEHTR